MDIEAKPEKNSLLFNFNKKRMNPFQGRFNTLKICLDC